MRERRDLRELYREALANTLFLLDPVTGKPLNEPVASGRERPPEDLSTTERQIEVSVGEAVRQ